MHIVGTSRNEKLDVGLDRSLHVAGLDPTVQQFSNSSSQPQVQARHERTSHIEVSGAKDSLAMDFEAHVS